MSGEPTSGNGGNVYNLGLKGWISQAANLTAVAMICGLFALDHYENRQQAKDDRQQFRQVMERLTDEVRGLKEEMARTRR